MAPRALGLRILRGSGTFTELFPNSENAQGTGEMIGTLAQGRYSVHKKLAPRGYSGLYLVEDGEEKRARRTLVLVEQLKETGSERRLAHFKKELDALSKLEHPNHQKMLDHGATDVDLPGVDGRFL